MMVVGWLAVLFAAVVTADVTGQSTTVVRVDSSRFPTMSVSFFTVGADTVRTAPLESNLVLNLNGSVVPIASLTCPVSSPLPVSCVIAIDASGGMTSTEPGSGSGYLYVARSWLGEMKRMQSECAVMAFKDANTLRSDFTTNRQKLDTAIRTFYRDGKASYDNALLDTAAGALSVAEGGQYKRVILLITDGKGSVADVDKMIAEAQRRSVSVYVVALSKTCPAALRRLSEETGGRWFENARDVAVLEWMGRAITYLAQNISPCEVTWNVSACKYGATRGELTHLGTVDSVRYALSEGRVARFEISPNIAEFNDMPIGLSNSRTLTVTAHNGPLKVVSITSSNPLFIISPTAFELAKGESVDLHVSVTPVTNVLQWSRFELVTEGCHRGKLYAVARFSAKSPYRAGLTIVSPTGAVSVKAGSSVDIKWTGIAASDKVSLQFSTDMGLTWHEIVAGVSGGLYEWLVPEAAMPSCIVRVMLDGLSPAGPAGHIRTLSGESQDIRRAHWSPDGTQILAVDLKGRLEIWNAQTGVRLKSIVTRATELYDGLWHPDGERVLIKGRNAPSNKYVVSVYNATTGTILYDLPAFTGQVNRAEWSPNGELIALAGDSGAIYRSSDGSLVDKLTKSGSLVAWHPSSEFVFMSGGSGVKLWDVVRGDSAFSIGPLMKRVPQQSPAPSFVNWDRKGNRIVVVVGSSTLVEVWDVPSRKMICSTYVGEASPDVSWSPDGTRILANVFLRVKVLDPMTAETTFSSKSDDELTSTSWSPDSKIFATGSRGLKAVRVWEASTGNIEHSFVGQNAWITTVEFSPDGASILSADREGKVLIWGLGQAPVIADTSDMLLHLNATTTDVEHAHRNPSSPLSHPHVFPNPITDDFAFIRNGADELHPQTLQLVDMCGRLVKIFTISRSYTSDEEISLNVADIQSGTYYLVFRTPLKQHTVPLQVLH